MMGLFVRSFRADAVQSMNPWGMERRLIDVEKGKTLYWCSRNFRPCILILRVARRRARVLASRNLLDRKIDKQKDSRRTMRSSQEILAAERLRANCCELGQFPTRPVG